MTRESADVEVVGPPGGPQFAPESAAAVDRHDFAGDEVPGGGSEIAAGLRDVRGLAPTLHGIRARPLACGLRRIDVEAFSADQTRSHTVDTDAKRRPLDRDGAAQADYPGTRCSRMG